VEANLALNSPILLKLGPSIVVTRLGELHGVTIDCAVDRTVTHPKVNSPPDLPNTAPERFAPENPIQ
jgi:hypothetical protein